MSMFALTILFVLAYAAVLFWFISRRYLRHWTVPVRTPDAGDNRSQLVRLTRAVLTFLHAVFFFLAIVWIPVSLVVMTSMFYTPGFEPDISFFANFRVDLSQVPGVEVSGLIDPVISGTTEVKMPAPHRVTWFLFALGNGVKIVLTLFVILQLRNIITSFGNGESFSSGNSMRLDRIGKVVIAAYVIGPFWNFFLSGSVINLVLIQTEAVGLWTGTHGNLLGVLVGVGLLVLSGVIKEAEQMQTEQRLTI